MTEPIEITVLNYLLEQEINGIGTNVYAEAPEDPPQAYILVEKTGSGQTDRINRAMIAVQSISRDRQNGLMAVMMINEQVKEVMLQFAELSDKIYSCKLNSDYNFTNTETKEYRYQAVFNIYY